MNKPILCLDFDGVCHMYTSGWKGAGVIPDEHVPGLFEFLESVKDDFEVQVLSSRSHQTGGVEAMLVWFMEQRKLWRSRGGMPPVDTPLTIGFPTEKPPALITLDDRGWLFCGVWPTVQQLKAFKPWYLSPVQAPAVSEQNLRVSFKVALDPSGELRRVTLSKDDAEIGLTVEQARSLVSELTARLG